jgi:hypothetical protein
MSRSFKKSRVLHDVGNFPYTSPLLRFCHEAYSPNAPKGRIGFGDSMTTTQKPPNYSEVFLTALCCAFFGGCAWETSGSAGFTVVRFANPRIATTLLFGDD